MKPLETAATSGSSPSAARGRNAASELARVRATCRRQARVIDALGGAIGTLRTGAAALKAENAELRAENDRIRGDDGRASGDRVAAPEAVVVHLPLDVRAPGAARLVVRTCLHGRVGSGMLAIAQLLISELVTNSVRHSAPTSAETILVRVAFGRDTVRLGVENAGCGGVVAPRTPDPDRGDGFGLYLVQALSERWGVERAAPDQTYVWAQLPRAPMNAPAFRDVPADVDSGHRASNGASNGVPTAGTRPARP